MAYKRICPVTGSGRGRIQAISSPIVVTFQPSKPAGGISMAKLVLPHADGKAAAMCFFSPLGLVTPKISICSANQPIPSWSLAARPM